MFGLKSFVKLTAAVAAALLVVSCAEESKTSQASKGNMIPDNAVMAFKVDVNQLFGKALGEPGSEGYEVWEEGKNELTSTLKYFGEPGELAAQILKNPAASGVCVKEPLVLSFSADLENVSNDEVDADFYLVALLDNSNAFVKVVDAVMDFANEEADLSGTKEKLSGNYTYYHFISEDGASLDMGVSSSSAVLRFRLDTDESDTKDSLKKSMLELFAAGGPARSEGLADFYASDSDMSFWMDYGALMNVVMPALENEEPMLAMQVEDVMDIMKNASVVADLDFKKGKTVLDLKVYGSEEIRNYAKRFNTASSDKYFEYMPATSIVVGNAALKDFAGLVEEMCSMNKELKDALEYLTGEFDFDEELFEGFPGIVTFALDGKDIDTRDVPGFVLVAECERNVWEFAETYLAEYAELLGDDMYSIEDEVFVMYDNGAIFVVDAMTLNSDDSMSFADTKYADQIRKGGLVINLENLPDHVLDSCAEEVDYSMSGRELLEYVNSLIVTNSGDHMQASMTLNMGDKDHNLLEKLVLDVVCDVFVN